jgi:hypothetical protein
MLLGLLMSMAAGDTLAKLAVVVVEFAVWYPPPEDD